MKKEYVHVETLDRELGEVAVFSSSRAQREAPWHSRHF